MTPSDLRTLLNVKVGYDNWYFVIDKKFSRITIYFRHPVNRSLIQVIDYERSVGTEFLYGTMSWWHKLIVFLRKWT